MRTLIALWSQLERGCSGEQRQALNLRLILSRSLLLASAALVCEAIELDVIKAKIGLWGALIYARKKKKDRLHVVDSRKSIKIPADKRAIYSRRVDAIPVFAPQQNCDLFFTKTTFFHSTLWPP